jgi:hypothetical protein
VESYSSDFFVCGSVAVACTRRLRMRMCVVARAWLGCVALLNLREGFELRSCCGASERHGRRLGHAATAQPMPDDDAACLLAVAAALWPTVIRQCEGVCTRRQGPWRVRKTRGESVRARCVDTVSGCGGEAGPTGEQPNRRRRTPSPPRKATRGGSIWANSVHVSDRTTGRGVARSAYGPTPRRSSLPLGLEIERRRRGTYHRAADVRVVFSVQFPARAADGSVRTGAAWAQCICPVLEF